MINELIEEYKRVPHGGKGDFFERIKSYGISKDKFHRERRKREGRLKTIEREADQRKIELVKVMVEMKERGKMRSDKPREMPTAICINRLVDRGVMMEGEISASHANYIMREVLGYREETPRVRWESAFALQDVQTDGSVSKYFRPWKKDGSDILLKASGRPLAYKDRDHGSKLILWQFQDKYSRLRIVRGFPGMAESLAIMIASAGFWWNREEDAHPMKHLPFEFAHDNAGFFKGDEYKELCNSLEISWRRSQPYEKTGIGSVERMWQEVWKLELVWSEDYPTIHLSDYNHLMHQAMIAESEQRHPVRRKLFRGDVYQQSLLRQTERPRILEVDVFDLLHSKYERTVTNELSISVENEKFSVPQGQVSPGQKINVFKNWRGKWAASVQLADGPLAIELEPFEYRLKGDYSGSFKQTYQQKIKESIASGESLYDPIMKGRANITAEGEYFDPETGEIFETAPIKRLEPKKEVHRPETPFTPPPKKETAEQFKSPFEAKVWIGDQLKSYGFTYADVASFFDERLEAHYNLEKKRIAGAIAEIRATITQTGT